MFHNKDYSTPWAGFAQGVLELSRQMKRARACGDGRLRALGARTLGCASRARASGEITQKSALRLARRAVEPARHTESHPKRCPW